jgi:predicted lipid-binding transport protein (Tim44 family)
MHKQILPRRVAGLGLIAALAMLFVLSPATARADMLEGGLLGSLFRGDAFTGPRLLDLAVIGLGIFVLLRLLVGRSKGPSQSQTPQAPRAPQTPQANTPNFDDAPPPSSSAPGKPNMYTNAEAAWASLKSPPAKTKPASAASPANAPEAAGTPEEEFLAGAKMAYSRIIASLTARDFTDLTQFVTPELLTQLQNRLPATVLGRPDILLIEATLAGQHDENGHTLMDVDYNVLIHEPEAPHNTDRRERWRFSRDNATPGAPWLLASMERR